MSLKPDPFQWYHVQFADHPRRTMTGTSPRAAQESYAHVYAIEPLDIPTISVSLHPTWNK
jgi:hypothetical protein